VRNPTLSCGDGSGRRAAGSEATAYETNYDVDNIESIADNRATEQPRNHATTQPPNEMTPNTHRVEPDVGDLGLLDGEQQALVGRAAVCEDDMRDAEDGASE